MDDEEGFDIYNDLEEFETKEKCSELQAAYTELEEKYESACRQIEELKTQTQKYEVETKTMRKNFHSLLLTAKAELGRKQTQIDNLQREKDNICFRRNQRQPMQDPKISSLPENAPEICVDLTNPSLEDDGHEKQLRDNKASQSSKEILKVDDDTNLRDAKESSDGNRKMNKCDEKKHDTFKKVTEKDCNRMGSKTNPPKDNRKSTDDRKWSKDEANNSNFGNLSDERRCQTFKERVEAGRRNKANPFRKKSSYEKKKVGMSGDKKFQTLESVAENNWDNLEYKTDPCQDTNKSDTLNEKKHEPSKTTSGADRNLNDNSMNYSKDRKHLSGDSKWKKEGDVQRRVDHEACSSKDAKQLPDVRIKNKSEADSKNTKQSDEREWVKDKLDRKRPRSFKEVLLADSESGTDIIKGTNQLSDDDKSTQEKKRLRADWDGMNYMKDTKDVLEENKRIQDRNDEERSRHSKERAKEDKDRKDNKKDHSKDVKPSLDSNERTKSKCDSKRNQDKNEAAKYERTHKENKMDQYKGKGPPDDYRERGGHRRETYKYGNDRNEYRGRNTERKDIHNKMKPRSDSRTHFDRMNDQRRGTSDTNSRSSFANTDYEDERSSDRKPHRLKERDERSQHGSRDRNYDRKRKFEGEREERDRKRKRLDRRRSRSRPRTPQRREVDRKKKHGSRERKDESSFRKHLRDEKSDRHRKRHKISPMNENKTNEKNYKRTIDFEEKTRNQNRTTTRDEKVEYLTVEKLNTSLEDSNIKDPLDLTELLKVQESIKSQLDNESNELDSLYSDRLLQEALKLYSSDEDFQSDNSVDSFIYKAKKEEVDTKAGTSESLAKEALGEMGSANKETESFESDSNTENILTTPRKTYTPPLKNSAHVPSASTTDERKEVKTIVRDCLKSEKTTLPKVVSSSPNTLEIYASDELSNESNTSATVSERKNIDLPDLINNTGGEIEENNFVENKIKKNGPFQDTMKDVESNKCDDIIQKSPIKEKDLDSSMEEASLVIDENSEDTSNSFGPSETFENEYITNDFYGERVNKVESSVLTSSENQKEETLNTASEFQVKNIRYPLCNETNKMSGIDGETNNDVPVEDLRGKQAMIIAASQEKSSEAIKTFGDIQKSIPNQGTDEGCSNKCEKTTVRIGDNFDHTNIILVQTASSKLDNKIQSLSKSDDPLILGSVKNIKGICGEKKVVSAGLLNMQSKEGCNFPEGNDASTINKELAVDAAGTEMKEADVTETEASVKETYEEIQGEANNCTGNSSENNEVGAFKHYTTNGNTHKNQKKANGAILKCDVTSESESYREENEQSKSTSASIFAESEASYSDLKNEEQISGISGSVADIQKETPNEVQQCVLSSSKTDRVDYDAHNEISDDRFGNLKTNLATLGPGVKDTKVCGVVQDISKFKIGITKEHTQKIQDKIEDTITKCGGTSEFGSHPGENQRCEASSPSRIDLEQTSGIDTSILGICPVIPNEEQCVQSCSEESDADDPKTDRVDDLVQNKLSEIKCQDLEVILTATEPSVKDKEAYDVVKDASKDHKKTNEEGKLKFDKSDKHIRSSEGTMECYATSKLESNPSENQFPGTRSASVFERNKVPSSPIENAERMSGIDTPVVDICQTKSNEAQERVQSSSKQNDVDDCKSSRVDDRAESEASEDKFREVEESLAALETTDTIEVASNNNAKVTNILNVSRDMIKRGDTIRNILKGNEVLRAETNGSNNRPDSSTTQDDKFKYIEASLASLESDAGPYNEIEGNSKHQPGAAAIKKAPGTHNPSNMPKCNDVVLKQKGAEPFVSNISVNERKIAFSSRNNANPQQGNISKCNDAVPTPSFHEETNDKTKMSDIMDLIYAVVHNALKLHGAEEDGDKSEDLNEMTMIICQDIKESSSTMIQDFLNAGEKEDHNKLGENTDAVKDLCKETKKNIEACAPSCSENCEVEIFETDQNAQRLNQEQDNHFQSADHPQATSLHVQSCELEPSNNISDRKVAYLMQHITHAVQNALKTHDSNIEKIQKRTPNPSLEEKNQNLETKQVNESVKPAQHDGVNARPISDSGRRKSISKNKKTQEKTQILQEQPSQESESRKTDYTSRNMLTKQDLFNMSRIISTLQGANTHLLGTLTANNLANSLESQANHQRMFQIPNPINPPCVSSGLEKQQAIQNKTDNIAQTYNLSQGRPFRITQNQQTGLTAYSHESLPISANTNKQQNSELLETGLCNPNMFQTQDARHMHMSNTARNPYSPPNITLGTLATSNLGRAGPSSWQWDASIRNSIRMNEVSQHLYSAVGTSSISGLQRQQAAQNINQSDILQTPSGPPVVASHLTTQRRPRANSRYEEVTPPYIPQGTENVQSMEVLVNPHLANISQTTATDFMEWGTFQNDLMAFQASKQGLSDQPASSKAPPKKTRVYRKRQPTTSKDKISEKEADVLAEKDVAMDLSTNAQGKLENVIESLRTRNVDVCPEKLQILDKKPTRVKITQKRKKQCNNEEKPLVQPVETVQTTNELAFMPVTCVHRGIEPCGPCKEGNRSKVCILVNHNSRDEIDKKLAVIQRIDIENPLHGKIKDTEYLSFASGLNNSSQKSRQSLVLIKRDNSNTKNESFAPSQEKSHCEGEISHIVNNLAERRRKSVGIERFLTKKHRASLPKGEANESSQYAVIDLCESSEEDNKDAFLTKKHKASIQEKSPDPPTPTVEIQESNANQQGQPVKLTSESTVDPVHKEKPISSQNWGTIKPRKYATPTKKEKILSMSDGNYSVHNEVASSMKKLNFPATENITEQTNANNSDLGVKRIESKENEETDYSIHASQGEQNISNTEKEAANACQVKHASPRSKSSSTTGTPSQEEQEKFGDIIMTVDEITNLLMDNGDEQHSDESKKSTAEIAPEQQATNDETIDGKGGRELKEVPISEKISKMTEKDVELNANHNESEAVICDEMAPQPPPNTSTPLKPPSPTNKFRNLVNPGHGLSIITEDTSECAEKAAMMSSVELAETGTLCTTRNSASDVVKNVTQSTSDVIVSKESKRIELAMTSRHEKNVTSETQSTTEEVRYKELKEIGPVTTSGRESDLISQSRTAKEMVESNKSKEMGPATTTSREKNVTCQTQSAQEVVDAKESKGSKSEAISCREENVSSHSKSTKKTVESKELKKIESTNSSRQAKKLSSQAQTEKELLDSKQLKEMEPLTISTCEENAVSHTQSTKKFVDSKERMPETSLRREENISSQTHSTKKVVGSKQSKKIASAMIPSWAYHLPKEVVESKQPKEMEPTTTTSREENVSGHAQFTKKLVDSKESKDSMPEATMRREENMSSQTQSTAKLVELKESKKIESTMVSSRNKNLTSQPETKKEIMESKDSKKIKPATTSSREKESVTLAKEKICDTSPTATEKTHETNCDHITMREENDFCLDKPLLLYETDTESTTDDNVDVEKSLKKWVVMPEEFEGDKDQFKPSDVIVVPHTKIDASKEQIKKARTKYDKIKSTFESTESTVKTSSKTKTPKQTKEDVKKTPIVEKTSEIKQKGSVFKSPAKEEQVIASADSTTPSRFSDSSIADPTFRTDSSLDDPSFCTKSITASDSNQIKVRTSTRVKRKVNYIDFISDESATRKNSKKSLPAKVGKRRASTYIQRTDGLTDESSASSIMSSAKIPERRASLNLTCEATPSMKTVVHDKPTTSEMNVETPKFTRSDQMSEKVSRTNSEKIQSKSGQNISHVLNLDEHAMFNVFPESMNKSVVESSSKEKDNNTSNLDQYKNSKKFDQLFGKSPIPGESRFDDVSLSNTQQLEQGKSKTSVQVQSTVNCEESPRIEPKNETTNISQNKENESKNSGQLSTSTEKVNISNSLSNYTIEAVNENVTNVYITRKKVKKKKVRS